MTRTEAETCPGCTQSLREDRRAGLIYGPYRVGESFVDSYVFAAATGRCTYCGDDLPKHRRRRLMQFVPRAHVVDVVSCW